MSPVRRWIRVDVGWDDTEWLAGLSAGARLSWIMLLCHTKRDGVAGTAKALSYNVAARRWGVTPAEVREMIEAAREDGAIYEEGGSWVVTAWGTYQTDHSNERVKRYRERQRSNGV